MKLCVLAPHPDDEVLGCGGTIARRAQEGWHVDIVLASSPSIANGHGEVVVHGEERFEDACAASQLLGAAPPQVLLRNGHNLENIQTRELVSRFDEVLVRGQYDEVLIPYASHHQEHRLVHEAAFSALRPRPALRNLKRVAVFEYPWIGWDPTPPGGGPWYVDITPHLGRKLDAMHAYRNLRDREGDHPISARGVEALAGQRGVECGAGAAELFRLLRIVE